MSIKRTLPLLLLLLTTLPAAAGSIYPMECGNLRRENRSLNPSPLQNPIKVSWVTPPCLDLGYPVSNPIILTDRVIQAFRYGVRCFDRTTGNRLWSWACNKKTEIFNAPCYDGGRDRVYVGFVNGDTLALSAQTGSVDWYYPHQPTNFPYQFSSPMYAGGKLYVGNGGTGFLCLDPDTRTTIWKLDFAAYFGIPGYMGANTTPAYDNGTIYLNCGVGELFSLNASTGTVQWHVKQNFSNYNGPLLSDEYIYSLGSMSQVECRNRADGSLVWTADTHTIEGQTSGCLALCGDMLIVPGDSWRVWGLNRFTGKMVWTCRLTGNFARNTPIVVCGKIYISACHGDFYSIDGQTGKIEWRMFHGESYTFVGWGESDGQLFVGTVTGKMMCFTSQVPGNPANCVCNLNATPINTPTPLPLATGTATPTPLITPVYMSYPNCPSSPTFTPTVTPSPTGTLTPVNTPTVTPTPTWTITPTATFTSIPAATPMTQYNNTVNQVALTLGCPMSIVDEARQLNLPPEITYIIIRITLHCGCHPHDIMVLRLNMGWDDIAKYYGLDWNTLLLEVTNLTGGLLPEGATLNQTLRGDANDPAVFPVEIPPTPVPTNQPLNFLPPVEGGACP